jgi:hydrogenase nickel incorporation protein HypB
MCEECGCGLPGPTPTRIDGKPMRPAEHSHPHMHSHGHEHTHADGTTHSHEHTHAHDHEHDHAQGHAHGDDHHHTHDHEHPHQHRHDHDHPHDHGHVHTHGHPHGHAHGDDHAHAHGTREVVVRESLFAANDRRAERNRGYFEGLGLLALNVVSSPGSGKTTLLARTIERLAGKARVGVIVGDLETDNDAQRLRAAGAPVVQVTTGTLCHLDAEMVGEALKNLDAKALDILVIENVGNLVCPAQFDLGEALRVVLLSVTEGEDKPLKYPPIFRGTHAVVVTKTDLVPHLEYDREAALANIRRVSPGARVFETSARTGDGLEAWCDFLLGAKAGV